jgi:adenine-specific DNA-methyltransferase
MAKSTYRKLELTWFNKDKVFVWDENKKDYIWVEPNDVRVSEPRILIEKKTVGEPNSVFNTTTKRWEKSKKSLPKGEQNLLIKGDNLLALKALESDFTDRIKLIYIDPPFNTGARINADGKEVGYEDGVEHSIWLSTMKDRLEILRKMLGKNGVIFVHIDNREVGYLKVLMDEVFSRKNFVQMISEKRASAAGFKTINPGPLTVTDYILMYAKNKEFFKWKPYYVPVDYDENYDLIIINPEEQPEKWKFKKIENLVYEKYGFKSWRDAKKEWGHDWKLIRKSMCGTIALQDADRVVSIRDPHKPSESIKNLLEKSREDRNKVFVLKRTKYNDIYIINGGALSFYKNKVREIDGERLPTELLTDLWDDINYAGIAEEGNVRFKNGKKPEMLLKRIIGMSTEPNDWVLDSFAGSGTTGAVAHKMGRRWITIELGPHGETHCLKRLTGVVNGSDQTGISKNIGWKGGGGFRYDVLGKSLFKKDNYGIIEITYDNGPLIEAICKIEGFKFVGRKFLDKTKLHGVVNNKRFCHVTEEFVTQDYVDNLSNEIKKDESLVIYCLKKISGISLSGNIEIKKIPRDVVKKFKLE